MTPPRFIPFLSSALLLLTASQFSLAQYSISSVAGGGPNNLPAAQSSIGFAQSVAFDGSGNAYIADSYSSQIFKVSASGTLTVVSGNGTMGYSGDNGPAIGAALNRPEAVFVDSSGNIFIADTDNSVIREVVASTGNIQTVAGNGTAGYSGDGSAATSAELNDPYGVFVDASGNIFIADTDNNVVREVLASSGDIQTVAGNGTAGYSGDGAAATSAELQMPEGVFLDASGDIFIADTDNSVIREVTAANAQIQTVAGTYYAFADTCNDTGDGGAATSAYLCLPTSIFVDGSGNLFIADTVNQAIRKVAGGTITTVAGTLGTSGYTGNGAAATSAALNYPGGVIVDSTGDVYIADTFNYVVREVTASNGFIQPFAGNNTLAYSGDGSPAIDASLNIPGGVFVDSTGDIFIADTNNSVIRVFNPGTSAVTIAGVTIAPGDIATVAGNGIACATPAPGGCGDGGAPTAAQLNFPYSVLLDASGNVYIADTGLPESESSVIRVINTGTSAITIAGTTVNPGTIQTVVGTLGTAGFAGDGSAPASAQLSNPQAFAFDQAGNLYIADTENSAIRVVNTGNAAITIAGVAIQPSTIETVAGTPPTACPDLSSGCGDNAAATSAYLDFPTGISVDSSGNIYVADSQTSAIRVVNPSTNAVSIAGTTIPPGDILTVAGTLGRDGYSGDNGAPTSALLNTPWGVWVDSLGNIFISDTDNSAIREVVSVAATIQTIAGTGNAGFSGDGGSATSATLNGPESVALGASGIFVADSQNSRIRQLVSNLTLSVFPSSTILAPGASQQFLATDNNGNDVLVTWQVNGVTGGNATIGTISTLGLYQAPATAPSSTITVTAIADANGTTAASAQVTLAATGAGAISITTNPAGVTVVYTGNTQAFTATVTGESNTAVTWEVNGAAGGNSTVGTIDTSGNYTAPSAVPSPALVTITAVSQADSTVSGSYPLTIVVVPSASAPAAQTVSTGGTANYSLALAANTGSPNDPITLSCLGSSLPSGASCSFNPAVITPANSTVAFSVAVTVPSSSAALFGPHNLQDQRPLVFALFIGLTPLAGILLLGNLRRRSCRSLLGAISLGLVLALGACGGNSSSTPPPSGTTYNIQIQGTTKAQPTPITITTIKLTVQ
jgi:trimeric autotransporter adhesin